MQITSSSPAFLYGESIFTTTRAKDGKVFFLDEHLSRLSNGIGEYYLGRPLKKAERETLRQSILEAVSRLEASEKRLRITAFLPERQELFETAYDFGEICLDFKASELTSDQEPLILKTFPSPFSEEYPQMKMGSYMPHLFLKMRAARDGADDALMLDTDANIIEATTSNIFFYKSDRLYAPHKHVLDGIIKRQVESLEEVEKLDIPLIKAAQFDGAFLTNSSWVIRPVKAIDRLEFKNLSPRFVQDMLEEILKRGYK